MKTTLVALGLASLCLNLFGAEDIDPAIQRKVDAKLREAQGWAADSTLVNAVKAHNAGISSELASMSQDKWKTLSVLDPTVRQFTKNSAALFLKSKQNGPVTEAFVSGADGTKVAFLAKTSNWSHKGKEKHEVPMTGKTWQGAVETDESTGQRQLQIAVPVMDGGKPIGSLVVGLGIKKLEQD